MPTIKLEHATKYYKTGPGKRWALWSRPQRNMGIADVDLTIEQGDFVFVIGSSGAGKSTLLKLIDGRLTPDRGLVTVDGKETAALRRWRRKRSMRLFGTVEQNGCLDRALMVGEDLMRAARAGQRWPTSETQCGLRVEKVLGLVGMRGAEKRYPVELTLGERRRVELAKAMINSPPVLVLDEITAGLDDANIWDIFHLLTEINRKGTTVVMATHAGEYVNIMRRRVITLVDGGVFSDIKKGRYGDTAS